MDNNDENDDKRTEQKEIEWKWNKCQTYRQIGRQI